MFDNAAMSEYAGDVLWGLCFIRKEDIGITGIACHSDSHFCNQYVNLGYLTVEEVASAVSHGDDG